MVGVSDDVNEYAVALRDTEDKIRRCPKRVRLGMQVDESQDIRVLSGLYIPFSWSPPSPQQW